MRTALLNNALGVLILALVLLIASCSLAEGIGYSVEVSVDNTTWGIERSTIPATFQNDGRVRGTGMVMRDTSINNIAGVSAKETTHTLSGVIVISEKTLLIGKAEIPVVITEEIKGDNESANITIREAWPTFLSTAKDITYVGPGISTREEYENNGDVICTSFGVKGLTKESRFDTALLGMNIFADIRPGCVNETICANKSSYYVLNSISLGGAAHIGCRSGEGIERVESSEDYIGDFKIQTAIKMKDEMPPASLNASIDWMPCTSSSEP